MALTDAQRRAKGLYRLVTWQEKSTVEKLDEICRESGYSRAEMIETMILVDYESLMANRKALKP